MIKLVSLEDACVINPKKSEVKILPGETEVTFLGMKDVSEEGAIDLSEVKTVDEVYKGFTYFKEGDILFAKITPCMENGKGGLAVGLKNGVGFGSTEFHILRTKTNVHNAYINHLLRSKIFRKQAELQMTGSAGQKRVPVEFFKSYKIPLPPLEEQKKIAAILDAADALHQKDKALIAKYEELTQSLFLDMFGDPVTNSNGWEVITIRDLVDEVKYGTSAKAEESGEYPYLRMNNITYSGYMDYSDLKYINVSEKDKSKYTVRNGDILFNRTNSKELVGKTGLIETNEPFVIAGYLIRVRTNELANPYYIWAYLNSKWAKATLVNMCKSIVGMANINAQELQEIKILKAPIELQNQFAERVQQIEKQKQLAQQSLQKSEELFKSLLQRAFKGELTKTLEPA